VQVLRAIGGNHAVLVTGLGPVGLAAGALCRKLGAQKIIGIAL
jgi:threonine dehydrogenase-like Zn-dependent dehydrogenase